MRYLSVCSGIEAATVAWHPLGWEAVAYAEIEKFPRAILAHHYPDTPLHGDFTTIGADEYGPIDLLVGGTPCQSFSIAGLRGGLDDDRGNLALEFLRLAQRKRPRWLLWENVPGVLSSNGGRDFGSILGGLVELGYGFAYRVLDAQYVRVDGHPYAVPQRRRRVFVVGHLGDWRRPAAVLFERESLSGNPPPRRQAGEDVAGSLTSRASGGGGGPGAGTDEAAAGYLQPVIFGGGLIPDVVGTLSDGAHNGGGLNGQDAYSGRIIPVAIHGTQDPDIIEGCAHSLGRNSGQENAIAIQERAISENPDAGPDGAGFRGDGAAYTLEARTVPQAVAFDQNTRDEVMSPTAYSIMPMNSGKDYKARETDIAQPVMAGGPVGGNQGGDYIQHRMAVRRLTPRECERLQGFPDDYTAIPWRGKPASQCPDGPRYKALGNSMAVPVMRWIGERIKMVEGLEITECAKRSA